MDKFKGFCKMMLGLIMCAPAPTFFVSGVTLAAVNAQAEKQMIAEFKSLPEYQEALEFRETRLQELEEEKSNNNVVFDFVYETEKKYYENTSLTFKNEGYLKDVSMSMGYNIAAAQRNKNTGIMLSTVGTMFGAILTLFLDKVVEENSAYYLSIPDLIRDGFEDLIY